MKALLLILTIVISFNSSTFANDDKSVMVILTMNNSDKVQVVKTIFTTLKNARKVAKALNIKMTPANKESDKAFIFSLKSEKQRDSAIRKFDKKNAKITNPILPLNNDNIAKPKLLSID
ncbi:MAG: T9SS C-terminal target domain-containing protein [Aureispira sp.]|nr:T9SS C-terminal target domain-containing protein [Aureispira sp.]